MGCLSSTRARGLLCAGFLVFGLVRLAPTCDAALTAGVGADYYSGPGGQIVRDVLGTIGSTGPRGGHHEGMAESMAKSAVRSIGSAVGREIIRGVLGGIMGSKKR